MLAIAPKKKDMISAFPSLLLPTLCNDNHVHEATPTSAFTPISDEEDPYSTGFFCFCGNPHGLFTLLSSVLELTHKVGFSGVVFSETYHH